MADNRSKKYIESYFCTPEGLQEIRDLIGVENCTLDQMSRYFGISTTTLYRWSKKHPEIAEAMNTATIVRNERIEMSLYDMCFPHKKLRKFIEQDPEDPKKLLKVTIQEEDIEPDFNAIQFVLTNQSKDKWKRKQELSFDSESDIPRIIVDNIGMFRQPADNPTENPPKAEITPGKAESEQSKAKKKKLMKQLDDF